MNKAWLLIICLKLTSVHSQELVYRINPQSSLIQFTIMHMGFLEVEGEFETFEGFINVTHNPNYVSMTGRIQVSSINTRNDTRDETILSEPYLDSKNFPLIEFESSDYIKGRDLDTLIGDLTVMKTSKHLKFPIKVNYANFDIFSFDASLYILRSDFNLDFGSMDGLIGDEIAVNISIIGRIE